MTHSKIEIKQCGEAPSIFTEIYIDGKKLHGVRRFELKQGVGNEIPILTVDLNALDISIDVMAMKYQYGLGKITDIAFEGSPSRDFIIQKVSELYSLDEGEVIGRIVDEWNKENPPQK